MKPHWDLGPELGIIDFKRGVKLAESRFYVLRGAGARLERALIIVHAQHAHRKGHAGVLGSRHREPQTRSSAPVSCPSSKTTCTRRREGFYLIPTAEVQLTNLHA